MREKLSDPQLTSAMATQLLARVGDVAIESTNRQSGINHNYRVVTRRHGTFHIKFHTAFWYPDQAEADYAAQRALAVYELLIRVGMPSSFEAWVDDSHTVVPASVYIATEMPGTDGLSLLWQHENERPAILEAIGRYFRRLHAVEFSEGGTIGPQHTRAPFHCGRFGPVVPRTSVRDSAMERLWRPVVFQEWALTELDQCAEKGLLDKAAVQATRFVMDSLAETISPDYDPPRLVLGNAHVSHLNLCRTGDRWEVVGCCDFEDVSAGDALADLMELETSLAPRFHWFDWRAPLFAGYGARPRFESHKLRVIAFLLYAMRDGNNKIVPDLSWLSRNWLTLLGAQTWSGFHWLRDVTPDTGQPT